MTIGAGEEGAGRTGEEGVGRTGRTFGEIEGPSCTDITRINSFSDFIATARSGERDFTVSSTGPTKTEADVEKMVPFSMTTFASLKTLG